MGRFLIGAGIMLALLGIGLYNVQAITQAQQPIAQTLKQAAAATDPAAGEALLDQAKQDWDRHWRSMAAATDHEPMDEIDGLFAQAKVYAQTRQQEDFSALCLRLSQLVRAITEGLQPTWWNFL